MRTGASARPRRATTSVTARAGQVRAYDIGARRSFRPVDGGPTVRRGTQAAREDRPTAPRGEFALGIVDPQVGFYQVLTDWIERHALDIVVVGAAPTLRSFARSRHPNPDVFLLRAGARREETLRSEVRQCIANGASVVVIAEDPTAAHRAVYDLGSLAILPRSVDVHTLIDELRLSFARGAGGPGIASSGVRLSSSEERAVQLYVTGLTMREVAARMQVKPETVKTFIRRVRRKYILAGHAASSREELRDRFESDLVGQRVGPHA